MFFTVFFSTFRQKPGYCFNLGHKHLALVKNCSRKTRYPEAFLGILQYLQAKTGLALPFRPRILPFTSFPIHYSSTILPFTAISLSC